VALLQHRAAVAIVAVAVCATLGVFAFARPEHRTHHGTELTFGEAVPPSHGWRWDDTTPGFHLGEDGDRWNISLLKPREIPAGAGVLAASRYSQPGRPELLYAARGCIGVQTVRGARRLLCPPHGAVVLVAHADASRGSSHPLFLTGVARSDVRRVTIRAVGATYVDDRTGTPVTRPVPPSALAPGRWGTFALTTSEPRRWDAIVAVQSARGWTARARITMTRPGDAVYCVGASGAVSCR
jgi:hypothetical protein